MGAGLNPACTEYAVLWLGHLAEIKARAVRRGLTNRWSGRLKDKVPSSHTGVRAAQLNR